MRVPWDEMTKMHFESAPPQLVGIVLAICGNLIISFALALTKYAHNLNQLRMQPLPYTHLPLWWCGLAATVIGECGNFAAYGFAGASLIAPLGAVSVLANAFIAALLLGEGLRLRDLTGCVLCIAGGSIVVLSTPANGTELDPTNFILALQATPFVMYIVVLIAVVLAMLAFRDSYGHQHVAYYVLLCSLLGSVTVMSCKGVATFLNLWLCCGAPSPFAEPVLYLLLLVLGSTAVLQVRYLNEAIKLFGNTQTVPVYYVLFTLSTIVGSNVLYRDFENEDRGTVLLFATGCGLTFGGVWLLTSKRRGSEIPPNDERRAPMLAAAHDAPMASELGGEAALDTRAAPPNPLAVDEDYEQGVPLVSTPLALSGDVLRRTFSTRLAALSDRAAQARQSVMRSSI